MSAPRKEYRAEAIYLGNGIERHTTSSGQYFIGSVPTVHGYVNVYAESKYAALRFIFGGALHRLVIRRPYTKRGLVTIARRFADDVVNEVAL